MPPKPTTSEPETTPPENNQPAEGLPLESLGFGGPRIPGPPLTLLFSRPQAFFAELALLPAQPGRYWGLLVVTGLVAGVAAAMTSRATVEAQAGLGMAGLGSPVMTYGVLIFSSLFLTLVSWALMWFLGNLGAGSKSRSAEVYGASFAAQLVWALILSVLGLFIHPEVSVKVPVLAGLSPEKAALAAQKYTQAVAAQVASTPALRVTNILNYLVYGWQFWLAYVGLRQVTGQPRKALAGVGYVVGLFAVLAAVYYLLNAAVSTLSGAA